MRKQHCYLAAQHMPGCHSLAANSPTKPDKSIAHQPDLLALNQFELKVVVCLAGHQQLHKGLVLVQDLADTRV